MVVLHPVDSNKDTESEKSYGSSSHTVPEGGGATGGQPLQQTPPQEADNTPDELSLDEGTVASSTKIATPTFRTPPQAASDNTPDELSLDKGTVASSTKIAMPTFQTPPQAASDGAPGVLPLAAGTVASSTKIATPTFQTPPQAASDGAPGVLPLAAGTVASSTKIAMPASPAPIVDPQLDRKRAVLEGKLSRIAKLEPIAALTSLLELSPGGLHEVASASLGYQIPETQGAPSERTYTPHIKVTHGAAVQQDKAWACLEVTVIPRATASPLESRDHAVNVIWNFCNMYLVPVFLLHLLKSDCSSISRRLAGNLEISCTYSTQDTAYTGAMPLAAAQIFHEDTQTCISGQKVTVQTLFIPRTAFLQLLPERKDPATKILLSVRLSETLLSGCESFVSNNKDALDTMMKVGQLVPLYRKLVARGHDRRARFAAQNWGAGCIVVSPTPNPQQSQPSLISCLLVHSYSQTHTLSSPIPIAAAQLYTKILTLHVIPETGIFKTLPRVLPFDYVLEDDAASGAILDAVGASHVSASIPLVLNIVPKLSPISPKVHNYVFSRHLNSYISLVAVGLELHRTHWSAAPVVLQYKSGSWIVQRDTDSKAARMSISQIVANASGATSVLSKLDKNMLNMLEQKVKCAVLFSRGGRVQAPHPTCDTSDTVPAVVPPLEEAASHRSSMTDVSSDPSRHTPIQRFQSLFRSLLPDKKETTPEADVEGSEIPASAVPPEQAVSSAPEKASHSTQPAQYPESSRDRSTRSRTPQIAPSSSEDTIIEERGPLPSSSTYSPGVARTGVLPSQKEVPSKQQSKCLSPLLFSKVLAFSLVVTVLMIALYFGTLRSLCSTSHLKLCDSAFSIGLVLLLTTVLIAAKIAERFLPHPESKERNLARSREDTTHRVHATPPEGAVSSFLFSQCLGAGNSTTSRNTNSSLL